ncbi:hypothetical protein OLD77_02840 [Serratia rubidaea]|nr:hypothetical protein [Serratia rubidaea]WBF47664.1 hypothetical protein OLD77_02840 [Serratia rubidaea]
MTISVMHGKVVTQVQQGNLLPQ